ncbi:MAG: hypothetical protein HS116_18500 [Planctomycetes bacterium]|nr:hypothetical protein [Planctomycetota bacterium]
MTDAEKKILARLFELESDGRLAAEAAGLLTEKKLRNLEPDAELDLDQKVCLKLAVGAALDEAGMDLFLLAARNEPPSQP